MDQFFENLANNPNKVTYGHSSVHFCLREQAAETVLIADSLFRSKNIETRKKYVQMVDEAEKQAGVNCVVFSSQNQSGSRLEGMTGVACILRYALPELETMEDDGVDDMEEEEEGADHHQEEEEKKEDDVSSQASFDQLKLEELMQLGGADVDYGEEEEPEEEEEK